MATQISRIQFIRVAIAVSILACGITAGVMVFRFSRPDLPTGITAAEYSKAEQELRLELGRSLTAEAVLLKLGEQNAENGKWETAFNCLTRIPSADRSVGVMARYLEGQVQLQLERFGAAEDCFREFLQLYERRTGIELEYKVRSLRYLSSLLGTELRFEERQQILAKLIELGAANHFEVLAYHFPTSMAWFNPTEVQRVERALQTEPDNLNLRVALGRFRTGAGRFDEAQKILSECVVNQPTHLPSCAAYLECLIATQQWSIAKQFITSLPLPAASDPWLLLKMRSEVFQYNDELDSAAACLQLLLDQCPTQSDALLGIANVTQKLGQAERSQAARARAGVVARIQTRVAWAVQDADNPEALVAIITLCRDTGLTSVASELKKYGQRAYPRQSLFDGL